MNPTEAKKILDQLHHELGDSDLKTVRLSTIYILGTSLFGNPLIIKRSSLRGRVTLFFSAPESERVREHKIREFVAKALVSLMNKDGLPKNLQDITWRLRLFKELHKEQPLIHFESTRGLDINSELEAFHLFHERFVKDKTEEQIEEIKKYSLLSPNLKTSHSTESVEDFKRLLDIQSRLSEESINHYFTFITRDSPEKHKITEKKILIRNALKQREVLCNKYLSRDRTLSQEERLQELALDAKDMVQKMNQLDSGESFLFMGSCGQKEVHLNKLFSLLQSLPETAKKNLAEPVQKILSIGHLPNPKTFVNEQIQKAFNEIDFLMSEIKFEENLDFVKAFLPDDERKIPEGLSKALPHRQFEYLNKLLQRGPLENAGAVLRALSTDPERELPGILANHLPAQLKTKLENGLKAGFFGNLVYLSSQLPPNEINEFLGLILQVLDLSGVKHVNVLVGFLELVRVIPQENRAHILRTVMDNLHLLATASDREKLRKKIEEEIKSKLSSLTDHVDDTVNQSIANFFQALRTQIPPEVLQLIDPEDYLTYSEFWIEYKKEKDQTITVFIYPSKNLLKLHPVQENEIQWPLKVSGVSKEKFTEDFFFRLLYQTIEPQCNPECVIRGEDYYNGILQYFGKNVSLDAALLRSKNEDFSNEVDLAKLMLTPVKRSSVRSKIEMEFELLNDLCIPHRLSDLLEISNEKLCKTLEDFIHPLIQRVEKHKLDLPEEFYRQCKATESEVLRATSSYRLSHVATEETQGENSLQLSKPFFKQIQKAFHKVGIDDSYIRISKPTLAWAFGEEVEDFIEALADSVGPLPKAEKQWLPQAKIGEKGWLKELVSSFYFFSAVIAMKTVLMAARFYQKSVTPFFVVSSSHFIGKYLLSEKVQIWLMQTFGYILQKFLQSACYLMLRCIMNPRQILQMESFAKVWKKALPKLAAHALGRGELSFDLNPVRTDFDSQKTGTALSESELTLPIELESTIPKYVKEIKNLDLNAIQVPLPTCLAETLSLWNQSLDRLDQEDLTIKDFHFIYLTEQIKVLPIPKKGKDLYWDTVTDPMECLLGLDQLSKKLAVHKKQDSFEFHGTVTICYYALLTMMYSLVQKIPEVNLGAYEIDYYDLIIRLQGRFFVASDPDFVLMLSEILAFYGHSFDQLPSEETILNERKDLLFSTLFRKDFHPICLTENRYLKERLQEPHIHKELYKASFTLENFKRMRSSSSEEKASIIATLRADRDLGCLQSEHIQELQNRTIGKIIDFNNSVELFDRIMEMICESEWEKKYPKNSKLLNSFFVTDKTSIEEKITILRESTFSDHSVSILPRAYVILKNHVIRCKDYLSDWIHQKVEEQSLHFIHRKIGSAQLWYLAETKRWAWQEIFKWENEYIAFEKEEDESKVVFQGFGEELSEFSKKMKLAKAEKSETILRLIGLVQETTDFSKIDWKEFHDHFFEVGLLSNLVSKHPNLVTHVVHFFDKMIRFSIKQCYWEQALLILNMARKAARLMKTNIALEDFLKDMDQTSAKKKNLYHYVRALILSDKNEMTQERVVSLFYGHFSENEDLGIAYHPVALEYKKRFWASLPKLQLYLANSDQANDVISHLFKTLGLFIDHIHTSLTWKRVHEDELIFAAGRWTLNLLEGTLTHGATQNYVTLLNRLQRDLQTRKVPYAHELRIDSEDKFVSANDQLFVIFREHHKKIYLKVTLKQNSALYELIVENHSLFPKGESIWKEVGEGANQKILCLPSKKALNYDHVSQLMHDSNGKVFIADMHKAQGLHQLARFCPLSAIKVHANSQTNMIERLDFVPFKLDFEVSEVEGCRRAYNRALFADFFIASKQYSPQLNVFGSYLLLENDIGEQKVLLPHGQWVSSFLVRFLRGAGPWVSTLAALIERWNVESKTSYSVFQINSKGYLTSEKPEDLAFLTILYLIQSDKALSREACIQFEQVCKRSKLSEETYNFVLPLLAIPIDVEEVVPIRQRMFAAIEANESAQTSSRVKLVSGIHGWIAGILIIDLIKLKPNQLSDYQEWFLFKAFFYHATHAMETESKAKHLSRTQKIWSFLAKHLQVSLEAVLFPDQLTRRLEALERKFGCERSWAEIGVKFAARVAKTPSIIPALNREVINFAASQQESSVIKELITLGVRSALSISFDMRSLKIPSLALELREANPHVFFKVVDLTPSKFKKGYLTYYEIASTGSSHVRWQEFCQMLWHLKGGWDKQTQILVDYLYGVSTLSSLFPNRETFETALFKSDIELVSFFETMSEKMTIFYRLGGFGLKQVGKFIDKKLIGDIMAAQFPLFGSTPLRLIAFPLIRLSGSVGRVLWSDHKAAHSEPVHQMLTPHAIDYSYLDKEDSMFNQELDEIFDLAFEYKNDKIILKSISSVWLSYCELLARSNHYQRQLEKERDHLITLFVDDSNKNPALLFEQMKGCFLKGDFTEILKNKPLQASLFEVLELGFACHLVRWTRLQQMRRAITFVEALAKKAVPSDHSYLIQQFAETLRAKRSYSFNHLSVRLLRRLVVFEYSANTLIWDKQLTSVKKALQESNAMFELLPSLGKNFFCHPLLDSMIADGYHIICNIFPESMFETSFRQMHAQGQIFQQASNALNFKRKALLNLENLSALQILFMRAQQQQETINMTKEDAQSLELIFIDRMNDYLAQQNPNQQVEEILVQIAKILHTLRTKVKVVGDEAHELFNYRQQLNYPIGPSSVVHEDDYFMIEGCMLQAAPLLSKFREKNQTLSIEEFMGKIGLPLAELMAKHTRFSLLSDVERQDLILFFSNRGKASRAWIKDHPLYRQFCMVRGVLTEILPLTMTALLDAAYGKSLSSQREYAIPYAGNVNPLEKFSIRSPHEALVKTFDQFLQSGLTDQQFQKLHIFFKRKIERESELKNISPEKTKVYTNLYTELGRKMFDPMNFEKISFQEKEYLRFYVPIILLYVRHFVREQVRYWKESACSNVQDFAEMFASGYYDTGTPYNHGTYPPQLKMILEPGALNEALEVIRKKYAGSYILQSEKPKEVLLEALSTHFIASKPWKVLLDTGPTPLLRGLKNESVAEIMIEFIKERRPDLLGVAFFAKDKEGRYQLVYQSKEGGEPVLLDKTQVPPEKRLTYIDDTHGFSANIPQALDAAGLVLLGEGTTLSVIVQVCNRLRGLKDIQKLSNVSPIPMQNVSFAILKNLKQKITFDRDIQLDDLIKLGKENEKKVLLEHYYAYSQKLSTKSRRACLDKVIQAPSFVVMQELFKDFRSLFIQRFEDDPRKLFGPLKIQRETKVVCESQRKEIFKSIAHSLHFTQEEKDALEQVHHAIPLYEMPEKVDVFLDAKGVHHGLMDDLNRMAQIEIEQDMDLDLQKETHMQLDHEEKGSDFQEWPWKTDFNPHTVVLETSLPSLLAHSSHRINRRSTPPLFLVRDLLASSSNESYVAIKQYFSSHIWFSNNYLPTFVNPLSERRVDFATKGQRHLFNVLVQVDETVLGVKVISAGCISLKDTAALRAQFAKYKPSSERKIFIYDTQMDCLTGGAVIPIDRLNKTPSFVEVITQLKFINGALTYTSEQTAYLEKWLDNAKLDSMRAAFDQICISRQNKNITGSDIDYIFKRHLSIFEQL